MTENNALCNQCNNPFSTSRDFNAKYSTDKPRCSKCGSRNCKENTK